MSREIALRPYQIDSVEKIRTHYRAGDKRVLLHLPTGAGKTVIFNHIVESTIERGFHVVVVTKQKEIVKNAYERMKAQGTDVGIIMAGHKFEPFKKSYVCSIDTLRGKRYGFRLPEAPHLIIIDEAHFAGSASFLSLASQYPDSYYLCVTATPWQERPITHVAQVSVATVTYDDLVALGFLVAPKVYAPFIPDLSTVRKKGGDFREDDLMNVMDKTHVYGNVAKYYSEIAGVSKALCFCINVKHSQQMAQYLNAQGIRAAHADACTSNAERALLITQLRSGELDVITNCNILSTGVDIPELRTIILARPTASRVLYVQQAGRGSRPHAGKDFFYLLDHSNNVRTHGFVQDYEEPAFNGKKKTSKPSSEVHGKTCPECFAFVLTQTRICQCGHSFEAAEKEIKEKKEAILREIHRDEFTRIKQASDSDMFKAVLELVRNAIVKGHKRASIYMKLKEKYGDQAARKYSARNVIDAMSFKIVEHYISQGMEKPRGFCDDSQRNAD